MSQSQILSLIIDKTDTDLDENVTTWDPGPVPWSGW